MGQQSSNVKNYSDFGFYPWSGILKNAKKNYSISET
jgi:hypothetical protein